MKSNFVSVIVPTYNRGAKIKSTLDSALAQTIAHQTEIIIVDDGSTDDTLQFLNDEYSICPQIRIITQKNGGVANARNRGWREARGEFIAFLDHDDVWLPEKLEKQLAAFEKRPHVGVVVCHWRDINLEGNFVELSKEAWLNRKMPQGNAHQLFLRHNAIVSMSVPLIRASSLTLTEGFDVMSAPCDDWDLWLRLSRVCHFYSIDETLVLYRRYSQQQSQTSNIMSERSKYVLKKQFSLVRFNLIKLWTVTTAFAFVDTVDLYDQAKKSLFRKQWTQALYFFLCVVTRSPIALLSVEWLYFAKRLLCRDSHPY